MSALAHSKNNVVRQLHDRARIDAKSVERLARAARRLSQVTSDRLQFLLVHRTVFFLGEEPNLEIRSCRLSTINTQLVAIIIAPGVYLPSAL